MATKTVVKEDPKAKETRFVRHVDAAIKNGTGVTKEQIAQANQLREKWNLPNQNEPVKPTLPQLENYKETSPFEFNYNYLNYDDARNRASSQLDPLHQQALKQVYADKYQNELNAGEQSAARGLSHSGLAQDQLTKIAIATQGNVANLEAERASKIAQIAQQMLDNDRQIGMQQRAQAFSEYANNRDYGVNLTDKRNNNSLNVYGLKYDDFRNTSDDDFRNKTFEYGKSQDTLNRQQEEKQRSIDNSINVGQLTGVYNGKPTLAGQQFAQESRNKTMNALTRYTNAQNKTNNTNNSGSVFSADPNAIRGLMNQTPKVNQPIDFLRASYDPRYKYSLKP